MHAAKVLHKILLPAMAHLDARNARNLLRSVEALITGRRLTLMELARHWPGAERVRAPLKRLDRLLGNRAVQAARGAFYEAAAAWLVHSPRPLLIVDWSELKTDGRWHLLRAGVAAKGRTVTVYEEVHGEAQKNNPQVEAAFLRRLKALLPAGMCPVIVTDAGFRVPWFCAVEALGWHWVGRVRGTTRLCFTGKSRWIGCRQLFGRATHRARSLGQAWLTQSNPLDCRLVLVRRAKRHRTQRTRYGKRAQNGHSLKMAASAKEPWLLACSCSLGALFASEIVGLYARRMQIEQAFRDLKSHRFGCAFEDTLTRDGRRLEILLLIHALATLVAWLEGLAAMVTASIAGALPRRSVVWLGWECLRRRARTSLPPSVARRQLRELLAQAP